MAADTKIEWADHTFNPWEGCQHAGPGCDNCYAEARNARFGGGTAPNWGPGAPRRRTSAATWALPRRWNAQAEAFANQHSRRQRVFCASLADVFDNAVDMQWREDLFALINATPNLDWLLLTKRIGNVPAMVSLIPGWLPSNVWLGATIVNQAEADRDIPKLLAVPARRRFLSMEPLLGPVDLTAIPISGHGHHEFDPVVTANALARKEAYPPLPQVDWVIVGGESGPSARPMPPEWARSLRDQCAAAGVPFLFKQWGEWLPSDQSPASSAIIEGIRELWVDPDGRTHDGFTCLTDCPGPHECMYRVGKKSAGRLLDGRTWDGAPAP